MSIAAGDDVPVALVRLTEVFRQSEGSTIVRNAHRILGGEDIEADKSAEAGEFFVAEVSDPARAHDLVVRIATERIPEVYGLDPKTDVQVLTPMHKGRAGTEALNRSLQDVHTEGLPAVEFKGSKSGVLRRFRLGDRVMQTRNDYEKGVFNGDVGVVAVANAEEGTVKIDFEGHRVTYEGGEMLSLQLAYAVSIHKSQGSEFEAVIVTLLPEHHVMLRRNLLYTAITRARKLCVVVGDRRSIRRAIDRVDDSARHTGLARRLAECFSEP